MSDLLAATAELVALPSLSTEEGLIADHVEALLSSYSWLDVVRVGDNVVARTDLGLEGRLVLRTEDRAIALIAAGDVFPLDAGTKAVAV